MTWGSERLAKYGRASICPDCDQINQRGMHKEDCHWATRQDTDGLYPFPGQDAMPVPLLAHGPQDEPRDCYCADCGVHVSGGVVVVFGRIGRTRVTWVMPSDVEHRCTRRIVTKMGLGTPQQQLPFEAHA